MQQRRPGLHSTEAAATEAHLHGAVLGGRLGLALLDEGVGAKQLLLHLLQQRHGGVVREVDPLQGESRRRGREREGRRGKE